MIAAHLPLLHQKTIGSITINTLFAAYSITSVQILDGVAYMVAYTNNSSFSRLYKYDLNTGTNSFITLPYVFGQGITTDGISLYLVTQTGYLLKYSTNLALLSSVNLGSGVPSGIIYISGSLYVSYTTENKVKKLNLSGSVLAIYSVGNAPYMLYSNNTDIIVSGTPNFKINIASGTTTSSISYGGFSTIRTNGDIYTYTSSTLYRLTNSFATITNSNIAETVYNIFYHPGLDKVLVYTATRMLILNADTLETEYAVLTNKQASYFSIDSANNDVYYVTFNYNAESYLNKLILN